MIIVQAYHPLISLYVNFTQRIKWTSRRPSGLRKTKSRVNSLAHRTTWLRSDLRSFIQDSSFVNTSFDMLVFFIKSDHCSSLPSPYFFICEFYSTYKVDDGSLINTSFVIFNNKCLWCYLNIKWSLCKTTISLFGTFPKALTY